MPSKKRARLESSSQSEDEADVLPDSLVGLTTKRTSALRRSGGKSPEKGRTCPKGHSLEPASNFSRRQRSEAALDWSCDKCFKAIYDGITPRHRCDRCDYDLCGDCFSARDQDNVRRSSREPKPNFNSGTWIMSPKKLSPTKMTNGVDKSYSHKSRQREDTPPKSRSAKEDSPPTSRSRQEDSSPKTSRSRQEDASPRTTRSRQDEASPRNTKSRQEEPSPKRSKTRQEDGSPSGRETRKSRNGQEDRSPSERETRRSRSGQEERSQDRSPSGRETRRSRIDQEERSPSARETNRSRSSQEDRSPSGRETRRSRSSKNESPHIRETSRSQSPKESRSTRSHPSPATPKRRASRSHPSSLLPATAVGKSRRKAFSDAASKIMAPEFDMDSMEEGDREEGGREDEEDSPFYSGPPQHVRFSPSAKTSSPYGRKTRSKDAEGMRKTRRGYLQGLPSEDEQSEFNRQYSRDWEPKSKKKNVERKRKRRDDSNPLWNLIHNPINLRKRNNVNYNFDGPRADEFEKSGEDMDNDKVKKDDGIKWKFLQHNGPLLAPDYEPLPPDVRFRYDGEIMRLSETTEEVCTLYALVDHDYTTKDVFNKNFMSDWRSTMTEREWEKITDLSKCDFTEIREHFKSISEERKARSKEEKQKEKEKNAQIQAEYGMCSLDGHQEKICNYRVEPPGLFRGMGEHTKQGMVKRRVTAENIIINCSKDSKYPKPPPGKKWKEVQNNNQGTWLVSWNDNIREKKRYVQLDPSSKIKTSKEMDKYDMARMLKNNIENIRKDYQSDYKKEMRLRQSAVALYLIDKLALRAGNERYATVGCCSLKCEHIELYEEKDGNEWVVKLDFVGKGSIRYYNVVEVDKRVWKNLKLFKKEKGPTDRLFDRLKIKNSLNDYLKDLMPGLTAQVFRIYNANITLQEQLDKLTNTDDTIEAKVLRYKRANHLVNVLCNHLRQVPKMHDKSMANLMEKIEKKEDAIKEAEKLLKAAKKAYKNGENNKESVEKTKKAVEKLMEELEKLEIRRTHKDENKTVARGRSTHEYLDPRISVAWCKKHDVPIEKVYNKTQRQKFMWAINMAGPDYVF